MGTEGARTVESGPILAHVSNGVALGDSRGRVGCRSVVYDDDLSRAIVLTDQRLDATTKQLGTVARANDDRPRRRRSRHGPDQVLLDDPLGQARARRPVLVEGRRDGRPRNHAVFDGYRHLGDHSPAVSEQDACTVVPAQAADVRRREGKVHLQNTRRHRVDTPAPTLHDSGGAIIPAPAARPITENGYAPKW